jgi:hypothetical protein
MSRRRMEMRGSRVATQVTSNPECEQMVVMRYSYRILWQFLYPALQTHSVRLPQGHRSLSPHDEERAIHAVESLFQGYRSNARGGIMSKW